MTWSVPPATSMLTSVPDDRRVHALGEDEVAGSGAARVAFVPQPSDKALSPTAPMSAGDQEVDHVRIS